MKESLFLVFFFYPKVRFIFYFRLHCKNFLSIANVKQKKSSTYNKKLVKYADYFSFVRELIMNENNCAINIGTLHLQDSKDTSIVVYIGTFRLSSNIWSVLPQQVLLYSKYLMLYVYKLKL